MRDPRPASSRFQAVVLLAFHTFVYGKTRTALVLARSVVDWKTFQNNCWEICLAKVERERENERPVQQHWSGEWPRAAPALALPLLLDTFAWRADTEGSTSWARRRRRRRLHRQLRSLNDPILISKRRLSIAHCGIYIIRRILRTHFYIFSTRFSFCCCCCCCCCSCCCCCRAFWGVADKRRWLLDANMTTILAFGVPQTAPETEDNGNSFGCFGFWQGCCVVGSFRQRFVSLSLRLRN